MKPVLAAAFAAALLATSAASALAQDGPPPPGYGPGPGYQPRPGDGPPPPGYGPRPGDQGRPGEGPPPPGFAPRPGDGGWDVDRRIGWMKSRLDHARADGSLDRRDARRIFMALNRIQRDEHRAMLRHRGLTDDDRANLMGRIDQLAEQMHGGDNDRRPW